MRFALLLMVLVSGLPGLSAALVADENGIVVTGVGEVRAKPNLAEIMLANRGQAELGGDAVTKFTDGLRRTLDAFQTLGQKNLEIRQEGIGFQSVSVGQNNNGGAPASTSIKPEMAISRNLRLVLSGVDTLSEADLMQAVSRIVDVAKDSGATLASRQAAANRYDAVQQGATVVFYLDNANALRDQAYEKAFAQARSRADRLAQLAGVKLAAPISVEDVEKQQAAGIDPAFRVLLAMWGVRNADTADDDRPQSQQFEDIPIRVTLKVRFALAEEK